MTDNTLLPLCITRWRTSENRVRYVFLKHSLWESETVIFWEILLSTVFDWTSYGENTHLAVFILFSFLSASHPLLSPEKVIRNRIHGPDTQTPFVGALWVSEWSVTGWMKGEVGAIDIQMQWRRKTRQLRPCKCDFLVSAVLWVSLYGFSLDVCVSVCAYSPRAAERQCALISGLWRKRQLIKNYDRSPSA